MGKNLELSGMNWYKTSAAYYKTVLYPKIESGKRPHYTLAQIGAYLGEIREDLSFGQFSNANINGDNEATTGEMHLAIYSRASFDDPVLNESEAAITEMWVNAVRSRLDKLDVMYEIGEARTAKEAPSDRDGVKTNGASTVIGITIEKNYSETERQLDAFFSKYTPYIEVPAHLIFTDANSATTHIQPGLREWPTSSFYPTMVGLSDNVTSGAVYNPTLAKYIPKMIEFAKWCYDEAIETVVGNTILYENKETYPEEWMVAAADKIGVIGDIPRWAYDIIDEELKKGGTNKGEVHPAIEKKLLEPFTRNRIPSVGSAWLNQWLKKKMESGNPPKELTDFIDRYMQATPDPLEWFADYVLYKLTTDPPPAWVQKIDSYFVDHGVIAAVLQGWFKKAILNGQLGGAEERIGSQILSQADVTDLTAEVALKMLNKEVVRKREEVGPDGLEGVVLPGTPMIAGIYSALKDGYTPHWAKPWIDKVLSGKIPAEKWFLQGIWQYYARYNEDFPEGTEDFVISRLVSKPDDAWSKSITDSFVRKIESGALSGISGINEAVASWMLTLLRLNKFPQKLEEISLEAVARRLRISFSSPSFEARCELIKKDLEAKVSSNYKKNELGSRTSKSTHMWYKA